MTLDAVVCLAPRLSVSGYLHIVDPIPGVTEKVSGSVPLDEFEYSRFQSDASLRFLSTDIAG